MSGVEWTDAEREAVRIEWHQHGIIGVHEPRQGAAQTIPGPHVLCMTCGWMQADTYHDHLLDRVAAREAQAWDDGFDAGHQAARSVNPEWPEMPRNPHRIERRES